MKTLSQKQITGMLLGGACGDALGAPIEFQSYSSIISQFGGPLKEIIGAFGKPGAFTDDTQMLLWTAEGMIRHRTSEQQEQESEVIDQIWKAYLRWLATQGGATTTDLTTYDGWLWNENELHSSRAPGGTCLGGLRNSIHRGSMGTLQDPVHQGPGCGVIMRTAPIAAFYTGDEAYQKGLEAGVLTHGEPGAHIAGGFYSAWLAEVGRGEDMRASLQKNIERAKKTPGSDKIVALVERAIHLADTEPGEVENLHALGGAWRGDEALALTVYAILSYPDEVEQAIVFAANHTGDCDSTGSTVGNMLGMLYPEQIPSRWLDVLEMREQIEELAKDLYNATQGNVISVEKYPV